MSIFERSPEKRYHDPKTRVFDGKRYLLVNTRGKAETEIEDIITDLRTRGYDSFKRVDGKVYAHKSSWKA